MTEKRKVDKGQACCLQSSPCHTWGANLAEIALEADEAVTAAGCGIAYATNARTTALYRGGYTRSVDACLERVACTAGRGIAVVLLDLAQRCRGRHIDATVSTWG